MKEVSDKVNHWSGVWALALGVSSIMIGEFLPSGLLTPIAKDLNITEGVAGQMVSITSFFAVISSLVSAYATRKFNRKYVLIIFSFLTILSSLTVAFTNHFPIILVGRVFLGIALGGFWSMSTAIALRIVEEKNITKALSIIFGSASFSAMLAAPLGSFLGEFIGWKNVFLFNSLIGVIGIIWLFKSMPDLAPSKVVKLRTTIDVLKIPSVKIGMVAIALAFCGRFASITYLRPYFEQNVGLRGHEISAMFFAFDLAYFLGTLVAGRIVASHLRRSLVFAPVMLALASIGLIFSGSTVSLTAILLLILGAAFAPVPVAWSTWGAKISPEFAETIGGLYVASVQLSAAAGASLGGVLFDKYGATSVFGFSSITWAGSSLLVLLFIKTNFSMNRARSKNVHSEVIA